MQVFGYKNLSINILTCKNLTRKSFLYDACKIWICYFSTLNSSCIKRRFERMYSAVKFVQYSTQSRGEQVIFHQKQIQWLSSFIILEPLSARLEKRSWTLGHRMRPADYIRDKFDLTSLLSKQTHKNVSQGRQKTAGNDHWKAAEGRRGDKIEDPGYSESSFGGFSNFADDLLCLLCALDSVFDIPFMVSHR